MRLARGPIRNRKLKPLRRSVHSDLLVLLLFFSPLSRLRLGRALLGRSLCGGGTQHDARRGRGGGGCSTIPTLTIAAAPRILVFSAFQSDPMSLVEVTTPSGKKKTVGIAQDKSDGVLTIVVLGATGDLAKKVPRDKQQFHYRGHFLSPLRAAYFPRALRSLHIKAHAREVPRGGRGPSARRRQALHHPSQKLHRISLLKHSPGKPSTTAQALRDHLCSNAGTSKAAGAPPVPCARSRVTRLPQFRAQAARSSLPSAPSYTPTTTARRTLPCSRSTAPPSRMRCV